MSYIVLIKSENDQKKQVEFKSFYDSVIFIDSYTNIKHCYKVLSAEILEEKGLTGNGFTYLNLVASLRTIK